MTHPLTAALGNRPAALVQTSLSIPRRRKHGTKVGPRETGRETEREREQGRKWRHWRRLRALLHFTKRVIAGGVEGFAAAPAPRFLPAATTPAPTLPSNLPHRKKVFPLYAVRHILTTLRANWSYWTGIKLVHWHIKAGRKGWRRRGRHRSESTIIAASFPSLLYWVSMAARRKVPLSQNRPR